MEDDEREEMNRMAREFSAIMARYIAGEITRDEMLRLAAESVFPGDPAGQRSYLALHARLARSGLGAAIRTAAAMPGVSVPIGPDDPVAN